jgi:hypothetical protein
MVVLLGILALEGALGRKLTLHDVGPAVSLITLIVVIAAVGLVVARHQPGNPIGWLMTAEALLTLVTISASSYTTLVYYQGNPGVPRCRGMRGRPSGPRHQLGALGGADPRVDGAAAGHRRRNPQVPAL